MDEDNKKFTAYTIDASLWNMLLHYRKVIETLLKERRWIPVSERLPEEDDGYCLICVDFDYITMAYYDKKYGWNGQFEGWDGTITHWMPSPEPPKDGD